MALTVRELAEFIETNDISDDMTVSLADGSNIPYAIGGAWATPEGNLGIRQGEYGDDILGMGDIRSALAGASLEGIVFAEFVDGGEEVGGVLFAEDTPGDGAYILFTV